jgi:hypothetical protein
MGLLKKANDNKVSFAPSKGGLDSRIKNIKKKKQIDSFLQEIKKINQGFEYSKNLFNCLCNFLNMNKAVLLVIDTENNTFIPGSYINIDLTTTRHLRIKSNILKEQFNNYNEIIDITDQKIKIFKQFFSIREFSALNSIILTPFYLKGTLTAILMIMDPLENNINMLRDISLNSDKFMNKLIKSRKPFTNLKVNNIKEIVKDPNIILMDYISNNTLQNILFLIITVNISDLKEALTNLLPNSDSFEISNNIIKSITQLISPTGELVKLTSDKYLIFYKLRKGKTSGIIIHQINLAIASFFNLNATLPDIQTEIKTIPENSYNNSETLLEGII